eukprot:6487444-Amphidinium_carterae.2
MGDDKLPGSPLLLEPRRPPEFLVAPPAFDPPAPSSTFPTGKRRRRPRAWRPSLEESRQLSIKAWYTLISGFESHSVVGRQLASTADPDSQFEILVDVLADKSTSTIRGRALSLTAYWKWARESGRSPSPINHRMRCLPILLLVP